MSVERSVQRSTDSVGCPTGLKQFVEGGRLGSVDYLDLNLRAPPETKIHDRFDFDQLRVLSGMPSDNGRAFTYFKKKPGADLEYFLTIDQLPKNAAGKIMKRALRKQGEIERGVIGA